LSINLGWKRKSLELLETIADKFILYFDELSAGDRENYCETIKDTIQKVLLHPRIFYIDKESEKNNSLFSILASENPIESTEILFRAFYSELHKSLSSWMTIYPLPRIKSDSYSLVFDGIFLFAPDDKEVWQQLAPNYINASKWHPAETADSKTIWGDVNSNWLICQAHGTVEGTRRLSEKRMRTFIAVLFSFLYELPNLLDKTSSSVNTYCKQFPSKDSNTGFGEMNVSIGNLLPPMLIDVEVSEETLNEVNEWYRKRASKNEEFQKRITTASHFIQYGIVADGLERFIHFFIALDALFGERGNVERLITEGIKRTFPSDEIWEYKISKLFDLRSSLVHGGCSSISEWEDLDVYRRHTKSHPERDVIIAAMTSFKTI